MKVFVSLLTASLVASQAFAGFTFTSVVKSDGARKSENTDTAMKTQFEGDNVRIEWIQGHGPAGTGKGYMLIKDGGKVVYMVNPEKKEYVDMSGMSQLAAGLVNIKFTDYKVEKVMEEAGPVMLGYPTRHYKYLTTYTMEMKIFGMNKTTKGRHEQEIWASTKVKMPAMDAFEKFGSQMAAGMGDLQKVIDAEKAKSLKGFPLKTVTLTDTGTPEKPQITKSIMEVTDIKEGKVANSEFEIPSDYKLMDMSGPFANPAAKDAAAKGDEETSEPAPKKRSIGLDSLFKMLGPKE